MTTAKIAGALITTLLGYAAFQVGGASNEVSAPECPLECVTTFALPPSSSLFL